MPIRLVAPCLVVLVGPSAAGKSTWARASFPDHQVVSTDGLRALVGEGPHDQRAGTDAFALLDEILDRRLARKLVTVVDSLGLDPAKREAWRALAARHGVRCYAVGFDTPARECRARNAGREHQVPSKVLSAQLKQWSETTLEDEGFDAVFAPDEVRLVGEAFAGAEEAAGRQRESPLSLRFGLQLPKVPLGALREVAAAAEDMGFESIWVMDHFLQIPQVGREWEDMPESWTTLGYLAAATSRARLGTLVTGITYRNVALVGKLAATLDVLSGGRAVCGIGAAWFEREHRAYGWRFPPLSERYALLEDALLLLPLMWGPGAPVFEGRAVGRVEAICYPRPVHGTIPILVGGSGERRTLRLVARYADACNLFGDPATVARKVAVLREHCARDERDPDGIEITHLAPAAAGEGASAGGASAEDHIGRYRELAEAGVRTAILSVPGLTGPDDLAPLAPVLEAFTC